jgi:Cu2+-exporting ATPase
MNQELLKEAVSAQENIAERELTTASFDMGNDVRRLVFNIPDMHCGGCIKKIETALNKLDHVVNARANLSLKQVAVNWNTKAGKATDLTKTLDQLGFDHNIRTNVADIKDEESKRGRELLYALAVAGFAAANIMLLSVSVWSGTNDTTTQFFHMLSGLIAIPAVAFSGRPFFRSALSALSARRLNMDVPISLAIVLALGMSIYESFTNGAEAYFDAAVTLLFFLLIGRYLDHLMREKARNAVKQLSKLMSRGSILIHKDGSQDYIELQDIKPGMKLRINTGERMPVDCEIHSGETDIDRSLVNGESMSAYVKKGDLLEAGVLNLTSSIEVIAASTSETSFLAEIQKMIEVAENGRGQYVRIADRMAQIYAPAVHILAFITFVIWMIYTGGNIHTSLYTAIAVLIITCPCALGLAVPVAHVIGANRLMKNGILLRDGSAFERLEKVDAVIFDKTGTLTKGEPNIVKTYNDIPANEAFINALASKSNHPLSSAISKSYKSAKIINLSNVKEVAGKGIEAEHKGSKLRLGKPEWVREIAAGKPFSATNQNASYSAFAIEGKASTIFEFEDEIREGAKEAVTYLDNLKATISVLSGDRKPNVESVANHLSIATYKSDCSPSDKITYIETLKESGLKTLMVGDGLNDAPALAAGYVSMAPSSACDVGKMSADFVFTSGSLASLKKAMEVSKLVGRVVKQNFSIALTYNAIAIPLAMAGYITPLIAALAMSASSILVVLNSMRIHEIKSLSHKAVEVPTIATPERITA